MQTPTLDLMALHNWDDTLFDQFVVPPQLNRDYIIALILTETEGLETMYPQPDVCKSMLGIWSTIRLPVWQHLYETTQYEYNPIHNYDRTEHSADSQTHKGAQDYKDAEGIGVTGGTESSRKVDGTLTGNEITAGTESGTSGNTRKTSETGSGTETRTPNLTQTTTGDDTTTESTAAFNVSTFSPHTKTDFDTSRTQKNTGTDTRSFEYESSGSVTDSGTTSGKHDTTVDTSQTTGETDKYTENRAEQRKRNLTHNMTEQSGDESKHDMHAFGNIGVTTTQDMIKQEREIAMFNLAELIVEETKNRFCVLVY